MPFKYCLDTGDGTGPCFKIMDCWWEDFDIMAYLGEKLSPGDLDKLQKSKPPSKVASIVELIEQAKKRK